ncbi:hypothetical protein CHS0354_038332 [Potamilus streckersoni]|uniref:VWFD domain-containing protein n=1 Tax=Potamilus streckersoni TaxID=2493646 RepID=A0AAE0S5T7_9BIVA|nr:hypothetical protein CHS0354_038332 [Potamilus streckersoni]
MSVVRETEYEYKVLLPTGTRVDIIINRAPTCKNTMNVAIQLSKKDYEQIEGLYGSFNGNTNDDFVKRHTGAITQDNNQFSLSWK